VRESLIKFSEWPWFNRAILLLILLNCCFLVLEDPVCRCETPVCSESDKYIRLLYYRRDCEDWPTTERMLLVTEIFFTSCFTAEMVIKIIARGFILHKHSYLSDPWNWLDFVVVVTGLITLIVPSSGKFSFLRTVRVLRPLRTMTRISGMRPLINTFIRSFVALTNVVMLLLFFAVVFGILGIEFFQKSLRGRCYIDPNNNDFSQHPAVCVPCLVCWVDVNLAAGYFSYDNILSAFLTIFQVLTVEGWTDIYYRHGDGSSMWLSRIFHSAWVFLGCFVIVQLALASLSDAFLLAKEPEPLTQLLRQEEEKTQKEKEALHDQAILKEDVRLQVSKSNVDTSSLRGIPIRRLSLLSSLARSLVYSVYFQRFIIVCIISNTVLMMINWHDQVSFPSQLFSQLNNINLVLTAIFIAEMVLKLFGLGVQRYFQDNFNCFDFFVVVSSIVELAIIPSNGSNRGSLSALRAVRLFRLFKLARSWKDMRRILNTLAVALGSMGPLCVIWVMFMYIFALLGMQLFGGKFRYFKTDFPRSNFDNFFPQVDGIGGFVTTFQIISTENWNVVMYNAIMSDSNPTGLRAVQALIPIAIVVFGNYIIMNLFISILLQGFGEDDEEEAQEATEGMDSMKSSKLSPITLAIKKLVGGEKVKRTSTLGSPNRIFAAGNLPRTASLPKNFEPVKELVKVFGFDLLVRVNPHTSLRVLRPKNPFRLLVSWLVYHPTFEFFIMTSILITSITLLLERPDDSWRLKVFEKLDQVFTIVFTVEMVLKIISDGFISHRFSYLRSPWNWLDLAIVIISLVGSFGPSSNIKTFKSLRTLRAIRPLRVIKRHIGLKVVVVCMISSIPAMYPVLSVMVLWFLTYAILGVNFYAGNTYSCYDPQNQRYYGTSYFQSSRGGLGVWQPKYFGFDSIGMAAMTLFEVSTTEGWMEVMAATTDIPNGLGVSPLPNQSVFHCIYACVQIIIGNFVLLNLIIGVVIANYTKIKNNEEGITPFLTPEQHEWKEMQRIINHLKPRTRVKGPEHPFRNWCFHLATNPWFEYFMTVSIVLNVLVMTFKTHDESDCMVAAVFWINFTFAIIFIFEAFVKLVGLGVNWYFVDPWNVFDFVVVTFSIFLLVLDIVPALSALRTFRILRVFRLIRRAVGLRQMIQTLLISVPSMTNIFALLLLIMTIFSVLALSFFYNVNTSQDMYGRMNDDEANYQYFDKAMWMLHRHTTGEAWNGIMTYCSQDDQFLACQKAYGDYLGDGCGGYYYGTIFHVLWEVIGTYVMMQLFTAVILENFHELAHADSATLPLDKLNEFVDAWTELDPDATQKISIASLSTLITRLSPPLG
ncbi:hypothetical protein GUITHDRAFT_55688, partial [Guillardia theta CCMP2712]